MKTYISIAGIKRSPLLKHYGATTYLPEKVLSVENDNWCKPKKGGLWTSPIDSKYSWKEWNEGENFKECSEQNSFILQLKRNAKIFIIDSLEGLNNAPLYEISTHKFLDFELIAKQYDAIWLTEKGQQATRYTKYGEVDLYGWDCETVLILNPDCCTAIK